MIRSAWTPCSMGGIEIKYKVEGMEGYDLEDIENKEQYEAIQRKIEDGVKKGGVNFLYNEDMYTVEFETVGMWIEREEE